MAGWRGKAEGSVMRSMYVRPPSSSLFLTTTNQSDRVGFIILTGAQLQI